MKILSGIHNHTSFSDGKQSPAEMVDRALELGFVSFGISDHSYTPWDDPADCLREGSYPDYAAALRELQRRYADRIEVLCGIEKDRESLIDPSLFDYVIGSVHFLKGKSDWYFIDYPEQPQHDFLRYECGGDKLEFARRYYNAVADHAVRGGFQILGHFDVIVKYSLFDGLGDAYRRIALDALDVCLDTVPYIEVNTGAIARHGRREPYPAAFLLERIRERGGKVILGADAHAADGITAGFDEAILLLRSFGFTEVYRLRAKGFEPVSI